MSESSAQQKKLYNLGYLIKLTAAAIKGTQPPEPTDDADFEKLFKICKFHDIANTVFYAVEKLKTKPEEQLYNKWRDERNMVVHRYMIQTMESTALKKAFNENGIDFMPVKGFPVCALYPKPDYRYMGDLDYLLREKDLKKAGEIVKGMGYIPDEVDMFHHDEYKKPPFMVVELHHSMLSASSGKLFYNYYKGFFDQNKNVGGHEYKMSDEDFYIFQLVHLKKHYDESGTGIRSFLDMYLINKKFLPNLDKDYIQAEFEKLNLTQFSDFVKKITAKWFENEDVESLSEDEMYIITSGIYGLDRHRFENYKKGKTRGKYIKDRLFPSSNWMRETYPVLKKHGWVLPFTYIHRLFFRSIKRRQKIKNEIKVNRKQG